MKTVIYRPYFVTRDAAEQWPKEHPLPRTKNTKPMVPLLEHGIRARQAVDASHRKVKIKLATLKFTEEKQ